MDNSSNRHSNNSNKLWIQTHHLLADIQIKVLVLVGLDSLIPDQILCPTKVKVRYNLSHFNLDFINFWDIYS